VALGEGEFYEDGQLRFGAKMGTGFNDPELARLTRLLRPFERTVPPVTHTKVLSMKDVHWVRPELVPQVGFSEWTPDGKLRHPRYIGLRDDKRPKQVVREQA
jgi:bifunctional non-homologous end joining protein LigD